MTMMIGSTISMRQSRHHRLSDCCNSITRTLLLIQCLLVITTSAFQHISFHQQRCYTTTKTPKSTSTRTSSQTLISVRDQQQMQKHQQQNGFHEEDDKMTNSLQNDDNVSNRISKKTKLFGGRLIQRIGNSLQQQKRLVVNRIVPVSSIIVSTMFGSRNIFMSNNNNNNNNNNFVVHASAPVMALPKAEGRDPASEAIMEYERRQVAKTQQQLNDMTIEARKIEAQYGEKARIQYENDFTKKQEQYAEERKIGVQQLKYKLLVEDGICPYTDIEGQRQIIQYTRGVDLGKVPGTQFYLEKEFERVNPKRSYAYKKAMNRQIIKCMVQDMINRNIDPVDYFAKHEDQTETILDMSSVRASALVQQYSTNLELYGSIVPPKDGEISIKDKLALEATVAATASATAAKDPAVIKAEKDKVNAAKKEAQELTKLEKAKLIAAKKEADAKSKAEKSKANELLKEQQRLDKQIKKDAAIAAKNGLNQAKATAAAAITAAATASAAATAAGIGSSVSTLNNAVTTATDTLDNSITSIIEQLDTTISSSDSVTNQQQSGDNDDSLENDVPSSRSTAAATTTTTTSNKILLIDKNIIKGGTAFVIIGGGGIGLKLYRDKVEKDEEERKRQLSLLMGSMGGSSTTASKASSSSVSPLEIYDVLDADIIDDTRTVDKKKDKSKPAASSPPTTPTPPVVEEPVKKRRLGGLKNVFGKKKNSRATDILELISNDDESQDVTEFTITLAKMLTFGAVGRFPSIISLKGGMSMTVFDLEKGKQILINTQTQAGLSLVESAEIFANVVNCMLIDIVDLASASLKEKDYESITVNAINVVIDFMNHAASLYDSIADGVTITPVTYGGTLSKSKLEQMYGAYAVSGMVNMAKMTDDFDNRVAMLQDVFQINEKKAEGLMMKAMQKNMMNMMKNGEGMEGMEEMLKGMGGMEGMEGLMGGAGAGLGAGGAGGPFDGDGPNPEQLKEMLVALKQMKDSGSIPPAEFDKVKQQFNEAFGSSIDDVVKEASANNEELTSTDKELLDLMKSIMKD